MHGTPAACARAGHAERGLAERGLRVDPALAGDHQLGAGRAWRRSPVSSMTSSTPGRRARDRNRSAIAEQAEPRPTRRAGARRVALAAARRGLEPSAQPASRRSSSTDLVGRRALLGSVGRRRARRAEQRVRDVAGDPEVDVAQARVEPGQIDRRSPSRSRGSEGARGCPRPPSVVALPPMPRMSRADAGVERGPQELAGPDASGADRVALGRLSRDRPDASASSTTARPPSSERSQRGGDRPPERVPDARRRATPSRRPPRSRPASLRRRRPAARARARRRAGPRAQPSASALATSTEVSEPLNESGAIRTVSRPRVARVTGGPSRSRSPARGPVGRAARSPGSCRARASRVRPVQTSRPSLPVCGVEDQQPAALGAGERLGRRHQRRGDPAPARPSVGR